MPPTTAPHEHEPDPNGVPPPRSHTRKLNEMHIGLLGEQGMVLYCRSQRRHIDGGQLVYEKCTVRIAHATCRWGT
jgi:hypothetical protein